MTPRGLPNFYASTLAIEASQREAKNRAHLDLRASERKLYSISRAIDALKNEQTRGGSFEAEVSQALIASGGNTTYTANSILVPLWALQRDLNTSNASGSGYLVGTDNKLDSLAELLRGFSCIASLPVTSFSNCVGNVTIPCETAGPTAYVLKDESTAITSGQPTIGQISFTPKTVGSLVKLTRDFRTMTGNSGENYLRSTLLKSVGAKLDALALNGSGTVGEPLGLIQQATGSVSGTSLTEAGVREFQTDIGNNLGPDCGFVTTSAIASLLNGRQRFTGSDYALWEGNLYSGILGGWPAFSTPSMPVGHLLFGAWNSFAVVSWGDSIELAFNPYEAFTAGGTSLRAMSCFDVGLMRPSAFTVAPAVT